MKRHNLSMVSSIFSIRSELLVSAWLNSNAIRSYRRLFLLSLLYKDTSPPSNSHEGSRELSFPRKIFYLRRRNCGTHSNHWFFKNKVQHRNSIGGLNTKVRDIQEMRNICFLNRVQNLSVCPKY